jgi:hypothetical protein
MTYRGAPAYIRGAIRQAADRWQTTDGVPLGELLDSEEPPTDEACPDCKAESGEPCHIACSSRWT